MPRAAGYRHTEATRKRIQASQLINRLHEHALGNVEMTATQVNAAKALINKVLPDLQSVEVEGEMDLQATINRVELVALDDGSTDSPT